MLIYQKYFLYLIKITYYLKQINFKMCLYKWQDGIPIFSKKLVFSKRSQKGQSGETMAALDTP